MTFSIKHILITLMAVSSGVCTLSKANEYKSGDCSGPINYGHHSGALGCVHMDATSHSVYIAEGDLIFGGVYACSGGNCEDFNKFGTLPNRMKGGCYNLDTAASFRIGSVQFLGGLPPSKRDLLPVWTDAENTDNTKREVPFSA